VFVAKPKYFANLGFASISPDLRKMLQFAQMRNSIHVEFEKHCTGPICKGLDPKCCPYWVKRGLFEARRENDP
jgi:hypothetical protein